MIGAALNLTPFNPNGKSRLYAKRGCRDVPHTIDVTRLRIVPLMWTSRKHALRVDQAPTARADLWNRTEEEMRCLTTAVLLTIALLTCQRVDGADVHTIGNSLTWDTIPSGLDGDVTWSTYCGKSISYIHDNPDDFCIENSTRWPDALDSDTEVFTVQPHFGDELFNAADIVDTWAALAPNATIVVHTGWTHQFRWDQHWNSGLPADNTMVHSPEWYSAFVGELRSRGHHVQLNPAMFALDRIRRDIGAGVGPFSNFDELFRDTIHMDFGVGKYLQHNLMRTTLGQPIFSAGFSDVSEVEREYLNSVIQAVSGLAGDFNNSTIIDSADYTTWLVSLGATDESLINDSGDGGGVTITDYNLWKSSFGSSSGTGATASLPGGAEVPEPTALFMFCIATTVFALRPTELRNPLA